MTGPLWTDVVSAIAQLSSCAVSTCGVFVTVVALYALYRQITDAKLAASMNGFLALYQNWEQLVPSTEDVGKLTAPAEWSQKSPEEKAALIESNPEAKKAWDDIASFFETLGLLVRTRAFPRELASQAFGAAVVWWERLQPLVEKKRQAYNNKHIYEHFEWLANEFRGSPR